MTFCGGEDAYYVGYEHWMRFGAAADGSVDNVIDDFRCNTVQWRISAERQQRNV